MCFFRIIDKKFSQEWKTLISRGVGEKKINTAIYRDISFRDNCVDLKLWQDNIWLIIYEQT